MHLSKPYATAILVFAHSSKEELKHKSIPKGGILFDTLTGHTLQTVKKTHLPYFRFSEEEQIGSSFGERFVNAIWAVFDLGYDSVITLGNDSPQLKASHIIEANNQLQAQKFVLGPSIDGGFYLMGLHRSLFNASAFKELPWQTPRLAKQLSKLITAANVEVVRLQTLFDIDNASDVKVVANYCHTLSKNLFGVFLSLVTSKIAIYNCATLLYSTYPTKIHYNKGSPTLFMPYCSYS